MKKVYCVNCKKDVIPKLEKLETGGKLYLCPHCGLALSAILTNK